MSQNTRCMVVDSYPGIGIVVVSPQYTPFRTAGNYLARISAGGGNYGAQFYSFPAPGQRVLCDMPADGSTPTIIAAIPSSADSTSYTYANMSDYSTTPFCDLPGTQSAIAKLQDKMAQKAAPQGCGANNDALPGDAQIGDRNAGGLIVGRAMFRLQGSPMSYVEVNAVTNAVVTVAAIAETMTPFTYALTRGLLASTLTAFSAQESMGSLAKEPMAEAYDKKLAFVAPQIADRQPLFRVQHTVGMPVYGDSLVLVRPPVGMDAGEFAPQVPAMPVIHRQFLGNGQARTKAASGISSIKTMRILAPITSQHAADGSADSDRQVEQVEELSVQAVENAALLKEVNAWLAGSEYTSAFRQMQKDNKLILHKSLEQTRGAQKGTAQRMGLPNYLDVMDVTTGLTTRYYDNSSFITQEADGSILIKDGYGSQIRMSMGNIYISSALDTFIRPGRDCVSLVPRVCSMEANQTMHLAAKTQLNIASGKDLKISGALEKPGVTVLENRSAAAASPDRGVIIRSGSNMSITAANAYIGLSTPTTSETGQVVQAQGTLVIDAGNSSALAINAGQLQMTATTITAAALQGSTGSCLVVGGSAIDIVTPVVRMPARLDIMPAEAVPTITRATATQSVEYQIAGASSCGIRVAGTLSCKSAYIQASITAQGNVISNGMACKGGRVSDIVQAVDISDVFKVGAVDVLSQVSPSSTSVALRVGTAKQGPYQTAYYVGNQFTFPGSDLYGFSSDFSMPGMFWQTTGRSSWSMLQTTRTTDNASISAPYPGYTAWTTGIISTVAQEDGILQLKLTQTLVNGYKTNKGYTP